MLVSSSIHEFACSVWSVLCVVCRFCTAILGSGICVFAGTVLECSCFTVTVHSVPCIHCVLYIVLHAHIPTRPELLSGMPHGIISTLSAGWHQTLKKTSHQYQLLKPFLGVWTISVFYTSGRNPTINVLVLLKWNACTRQYRQLKTDYISAKNLF